MARAVAPAEAGAVAAEHYGDDLWDLAWDVARVGEVMEKAADSLELSLVARHALELATKFNAVYHRHPILQEEDEAVRRARLATVQVFRRGLDELAGVLGVPIPERM
jgi:arginyl-tRNA synthetase